MSKLRAAVVGVGYLGTFHAQKYTKNSNVQLVGVCDFSPAQADKVAAELGVAAIHKAQDLVGQVDMVTVAASTQSHYELAKLFLQNGIHVNVEKPIAATIPQAEELVNLAQQKNLKLAVGHIERFNPSIIELKKHLKDTKTLELTRLATYKARGADVSVLHDLMIHDMDLLYWLSDSDIESFTASGSKLISSELDTAQVAFKMKSGLMVYINVSRVSSNMQRWIRATQKGSVLYANTGTLELEKNEPGSGDTPVKVSTWTVTKEDALQKETDAFIEAVKNNTPTVVNGLDGLKALKAIEEVKAAIEARL
ncbi:Gfo/Idh/MocA family protein [Bdellovibrio sp. HCB337]|uniref:Gfo/Idh/MocA family protein n=1 Tax=Bdellovibrio sp. HCB337 TaxID=3394358 RepID=UPI0039A42B54